MSSIMIRHFNRIQLNRLCFNANITGSYITISKNDKLLPSNVTNNHAKGNFTRFSSTHTGLRYYLSTDFAPIACAEHALTTVHQVTGLPWWAAISLTAVALRTAVTLPAAVYAAKVQFKLESLKPEVQELGKELAGEVAMAQRQYNWSERRAKASFKRNMKQLVKKLYIRDNCHPLKTTLVAWLQMPIWFSVSLGLRNMAGALPILGDIPVLHPDLAVQGTLWFHNLLVPDATYILPLLLSTSTLLITEMHALKTENPALLQRILTYSFRAISIIMIPIAANVPSCMALYWTCSSVYGLGQNIVLSLPKVRRKLGIKKSESESDTPFKDMIYIARKKYIFLPNPPEVLNKR